MAHPLLFLSLLFHQINQLPRQTKTSATLQIGLESMTIRLCRQVLQPCIRIIRLDVFKGLLHNLKTTAEVRIQDAGSALLQRRLLN